MQKADRKTSEKEGKVLINEKNQKKYGETLETNIKTLYICMILLTNVLT